MTANCAAFARLSGEHSARAAMRRVLGTTRPESLVVYSWVEFAQSMKSCFTAPQTHNSFAVVRWPASSIIIYIGSESWLTALWLDTLSFVVLSCSVNNDFPASWLAWRYRHKIFYICRAILHLFWFNTRWWHSIFPPALAASIILIPSFKKRKEISPNLLVKIMNSQFFDQRNEIHSSKQFCLFPFQCFNVIADYGALGPSHPFKCKIMNPTTASEKINLDEIVIRNNDVFSLLSSAKIERR